MKPGRKEEEYEDGKEKEEELISHDLYDIADSTMKIHSGAPYISKDYNLAIRDAREDKFIRKHRQIILAEAKFLDPLKVRRQYAGYNKAYKPDAMEIERAEKEIAKMKTQVMMTLTDDINSVNTIARNRDGFYFKKILGFLGKSVERENESSMMENIPVLGKLFKKDKKAEED